MTPRLARIKQGVRLAIERCGNIDGVVTMELRRRSVVGDWHNLNTMAFPPVDCALALDEIAIAQGKAPAILSRLAAELGHVAVRLPEVGVGADALTRALVEASAEFGDIACAVRDATRDGEVSPAEADRIVAQIDECMTALVTLRAVVSG